MKVIRGKSVNCEHTKVLHTIIREFVAVKLYHSKEWPQNVLMRECTRRTIHFFHTGKAAHFAAKETDTLLFTNKANLSDAEEKNNEASEDQKKSCEECRPATRTWNRRWFMLEENLPHFRGRNPTPQLHIAPLWT